MRPRVEPLQLVEWDKRIRQKSYLGKDSQKLPFIAWDGEGYTDTDGVHHYNLFGCSEGEYVRGQSLGYLACFELLLDVAKRHKGIHVIFAGGYDMTMMIKNMPTHIAARIMQGHATWWNNYRIEYFRGKYLKLSSNGRSIILYDVFTFFSTSFVKACREYLGESDDFNRIERTKLRRDSFSNADLDELVIPYWREELKYLVELCTILRTRLADADIEPRQWHGPGAVASTVLRDRGINSFRNRQPDHILEAARHAYYGGRFEQYKVGFAVGPIYQYDIRSAYPYAISRLPSLAGLAWKRRTNVSSPHLESFGLYKVTLDMGDRRDLRQMAPLPWRNQDGAIFYPHHVHSSWYWGIELQAIQRTDPDGVRWPLTFHEAWVPDRHSYEYPFGWVQDMYDQRAQLKREGNPTQLALKLAMNSLYGKLAQAKGAKLRANSEGEREWQLPAYHQLEWAGWITAATRAKIWEAMVQAGDSLIAVETDAVYTTKKLDLPLSEKLGDWEEEIADGILYVLSGVYFKSSKGDWKLKSRGFEPRGHTFDTWIEAMQELPFTDRTVKQTVRRFGSIPGQTNFARWYEQERESNIMNLGTKRIHIQNHSSCSSCSIVPGRRSYSYADRLHDLIVPQYLIPSGSVPSKPHGLPWVTGYSEFEQDWLITEDFYMSEDIL